MRSAGYEMSFVKIKHLKTPVKLFSDNFNTLRKSENQLNDSSLKRTEDFRYYSQPVKTRKPLFHRHLKISP